MRQWHFYEVHEVHSKISLQQRLQDFHVSKLYSDNCRLTHGVVILSLYVNSAIVKRTATSSVFACFGIFANQLICSG